jgi:hypothetical protein
MTRCRFGRPHVWVLMFREGVKVQPEQVECSMCGKVEPL